MSSAHDSSVFRLRPHHGMCLPKFVGKGYGDAFTRNMTAVHDFLYQNPGTEIIIKKGCDDLCAHCPHRIVDRCDSEHPDLFDERVLKMTGLNYGDHVTFAEFVQRTEPLRKDHLGEVCGECSWYEFCREIGAAAGH